MASEPTAVFAFNEEVDEMNRTFRHLPKLGLAVCIGVIACLTVNAWIDRDEIVFEFMKLMDVGV